MQSIVEVQLYNDKRTERTKTDQAYPKNPFKRLETATYKRSFDEAMRVAETYDAEF